jgi:CRP/FNR family transcriptional regulator, cyclic AMP receptor protein
MVGRAPKGARRAPGWLGGDRLSSADREAVLASSREVRVRRHEPLLRSGSDATIYLLRGAAMVRSISSSGHSTVLRILAPGSSWGLASSIGNIEADFDVEAATESHALVTPGHVIRELVRERPAVARACLESVSQQLAELQEETARFHNTSTTERVLHRLVQLADTWGRPKGRHIDISLRITQEDLATWARSSRESTTKTLQELREAGVITTGRRAVTVHDLPELRRRATSSPTQIDLRDEADVLAPRPADGPGARRAR